MVQYDLDNELAKQFESRTVSFILDLDQWNNLTLPLVLSWKVIRFRQGNLKAVPNGQAGIYTFVVKPEIAKHPECAYLMYVGRTRDFRRRYKEYLQYQKTRKGSPLVVRMLTTWPQHLWFCYASINNNTLIDTTEDKLISAYLPPVNEQYPAEVRTAMSLWRK